MLVQAARIMPTQNNNENSSNKQTNKQKTAKTTTKTQTQSPIATKKKKKTAKTSTTKTQTQSPIATNKQTNKKQTNKNPAKTSTKNTHTKPNNSKRRKQQQQNNKTKHPPPQKKKGGGGNKKAPKQKQTKQTKFLYFHSRLTDSTRDKFSYSLGESIAILSITYQKQSGEYGRPCKVEDSLRDKTKLAFMLLNVHGGEMAY